MIFDIKMKEIDDDLGVVRRDKIFWFLFRFNFIFLLRKKLSTTYFNLCIAIDGDP